MKKKFLLALVVVSALICIFAISASAATMTSIDGETLTITEYDDAPSKTNITVSIYDLVVFDDGFVCPSAYIFKDNAINYGDGDGDARIQHCLDFTYINGKRATETGNEDFAYTYKNIVEFDLPEGVTHFTKRAFQNVTTIRKVTIPKTVKTISTATFQNASGLEEFVFEHGERDDLKTIPGYMFYGCKKLKAVSLPDCATKIADAATFASCSTLGAVYLPKNLTTIVSGGGGSRNATFDDCYAVYFVNTPFTTSDTAPEKPTIYYFPENLESISNNSVMRECRALNDVLVFGTQLTTMPNQYFFQNGPANKIVFLGDMTTVSTQYWGKTTHIFFANPADKGTDDVIFSGGKTTVFCNATGNTTHLVEPKATVKQDPTCISAGYEQTYCFCKAPIAKTDKEATGIHTFVTNDCTVSVMCTGDENCDAMSPANAEHDLTHTLVYANGFNNEGVYNCYCNVAGCTMADKEIRDGSKDAIITFKGYSRALSNAYLGIDAGYKVDKDLLALYNEVNTTDATLTLFMINSKYEDVNISKIFKEGTLELETNVKGINVSISSTNYTDISVSVKGFDNANEEGSFYTLALISAIAVKTEAGVHYIQAGLKNSPNTTITVDGVDFNIVTANNVYNPTGA